MSMYMSGFATAPALGDMILLGAQHVLPCENVSTCGHTSSLLKSRTKSAPLVLRCKESRRSYIMGPMPH